MENIPVIECINLSVKYGNDLILDNINFKVYKGEIFVIVGGSGCGKSTLLRQIIGLENPTSGYINILGNNLTQSTGENRRNIMQKFGVLFQSGGLLASMTIAENIALPLEKYTSLHHASLDELIEMKLKSVGLTGYKNHYPSELSGGMKKRAALARAMALDPEILCFDEPSSGLDPATSAILDKLIVEINSLLGTTMIVVTHDLASIMEISHRIIMLDKTKKGIIAEGTPNKLKNSNDNETVYKFFNRLV